MGTIYGVVYISCCPQGNLHGAKCDSAEDIVGAAPSAQPCLRALPSCPLLLHINCLHILDLQHTVTDTSLVVFSKNFSRMVQSHAVSFTLPSSTSLSLSDHCNSYSKYQGPKDNFGCLRALREQFSYLLLVCTSIVLSKLSWHYTERAIICRNILMLIACINTQTRSSGHVRPPALHPKLR